MTSEETSKDEATAERMLRELEAVERVLGYVGYMNRKAQAAQRGMDRLLGASVEVYRRYEQLLERARQ